MSARRKPAPSNPQAASPSELKIPLPEAQAKLTERIDAGRELVDVQIAGLASSAALAQAQDAWEISRGRAAGSQHPGIDSLRHEVANWRDFNRTWLRRNLGGEAAEEYEEVSQHFPAMVDDPARKLQFLAKDVEREISKLRSIYDRLDMWVPDEARNTAGYAKLSDSSAAARPGEAQPGRDQTGHISTNRKAVMVVYGHDAEAREWLFAWLRAIGLEPKEWGQLVNLSGKAGPYILDVLEHAFRNAQAVIALFSPDEYVSERISPPESGLNWRLQARPNVYIEAGMALVTHPDRTIFVVHGRQRLPSDFDGISYVRLDGKPESLNDIANRLKAAGCDVDLTGRDWLALTEYPERDKIPETPPDADR